LLKLEDSSSNEHNVVHISQAFLTTYW